MIVVTGAAWLARGQIHAVVQRHPALLIAVVVGTCIWFAAIASVLRMRRENRARAWRARVEDDIGIGEIAPPGWLARWSRRLPDPLEELAGPLLRTRWGRRLSHEWRQSGFGQKGSRYLLMLAVLAGGVAYLGAATGGPILALALAFSIPLLPIRWVRGRAEERERRLSEQVPLALDGIAAGLSAGLSFDNAIQFASEELSSPINEALARLHRLLLVGHPFDFALERWQREFPVPSLGLAMEGVRLQRQLGGDMIRMLSETAELVRARMELEREVHAVTAQGRLSGWVIAALVPVSAAVLLSSNPRYIDVLFESLIGQVLLAVAICLQLLGWSMISRLIQIGV
jgi:tight adherence protein B